MLNPLQPLHTSHPRHFRDNKFVYPVLSRRSKGISLGINLNPDKVCNFDCVYCQVDRRSEAETKFVELDRLWTELDDMLECVATGRLYQMPEFSQIAPELRRLNDVAFSGDGEPTSFRNFADLVAGTADIRDRHAMADVKLVLITNASLFHRPEVRRGLQILDERYGEIWAKLDAGTAAYFELIERTRIPFERILQNITDAAMIRPLVIQSLFLKWNGQAPDNDEIAAYCGRLRDVCQSGGRIQLVQIYTVARPPAESGVTPLTIDQLEAIAARVRELPLPVEVYPGRA